MINKEHLELVWRASVENLAPLGYQVDVEVGVAPGEGTAVDIFVLATISAGTRDFPAGARYLARKRVEFDETGTQARLVNVRELITDGIPALAEQIKSEARKGRGENV